MDYGYDRTLYVSGNKIKLDDMRKILGDHISTFNTKIKEIQGIPVEVTEVESLLQIKLKLGDEVSGGTSKQGKIVTREGEKAAHLKHSQTPAEGARFGDEEDDPG